MNREKKKKKKIDSDAFTQTNKKDNQIEGDDDSKKEQTIEDGIIAVTKRN